MADNSDYLGRALDSKTRRLRDATFVRRITIARDFREIGGSRLKSMSQLCVWAAFGGGLIGQGFGLSADAFEMVFELTDLVGGEAGEDFFHCGVMGPDGGADDGFSA